MPRHNKLTAWIEREAEASGGYAALAGRLLVDEPEDATLQPKTLSRIARGLEEPSRRIVALIARDCDLRRSVVEGWLDQDAETGLELARPKARGGRARRRMLTQLAARALGRMGASGRARAKLEAKEAVGQESLPLHC